MVTWSNPMKLKEAPFYQGFLSTPGIFELGFVDAQGLDPVYIGVASHSLYAQLYGYATGRAGNRLLANAIKKQDEPVWFRVVRYGEAGYSEARAVHQQEIGGAGQYPWNGTYGRRSAAQDG